MCVCRRVLCREGGREREALGQGVAGVGWGESVAGKEVGVGGRRQDVAKRTAVRVRYGGGRRWL